ncbi:hypothetical protein ACTOB_003068 [Actinoplanes oblitus]|uniref:JAB-N domain-containing protein n=1 Tax=Actinoplanes oblitus TaxID=3040509 RepID=A0ABY8WRI8_9ACTN|nr:JAB N-terminal domain-containing protein [Actinoplanes oblitus]WIM99417.1 hypothetical protein ACTOB_003068 [Actinoplanes oblitus]
MQPSLDIYRSDDYVSVGRLDLLAVLQAAFERMLGQRLDDTEFQLTFHRINDDQRPSGRPSVVNLQRAFGYVHVRITRDGKVLYQHLHSLRELMTGPLRALLSRLAPEETHWGFGISGIPEAPRKPSPSDARLIAAAAGAEEPAMSRVEELPDEEAPEADGTRLGAPPDAGDDLAVVLAGAAYRKLTAELPHSTEVESGGFLVGRLCRDTSRAGRHLVLIDDVLPAQRTAASTVRLTFTAESFLRANHALSRRPGDRLLGWWHTHLFPATDRFGLSSADVELHLRTYRRPWQVAGLLNLDDGGWTLRFYARRGRELALIPYGVSG